LPLTTIWFLKVLELFRNRVARLVLSVVYGLPSFPAWKTLTWFDYETEQQAMHAAVDFMRDGKDPSA
jgi:hypothetical protein